MGALLIAREMGRWVWDVGGLSSRVGPLWRVRGSLQMGFNSEEEQIVQSGTGDGDSAIPALASPASSLRWRRREAICHGSCECCLEK